MVSKNVYAFFWTSRSMEVGKNYKKLEKKWKRKDECNKNCWYVPKMVALRSQIWQAAHKLRARFSISTCLRKNSAQEIQNQHVCARTPRKIFSANKAGQELCEWNLSKFFLLIFFFSKRGSLFKKNKVTSSNCCKHVVKIKKFCCKP